MESGITREEAKSSGGGSREEVKKAFMDTAALRRDHDTALILLRRGGMNPAHDPVMREELRRVFTPVFIALQDEITTKNPLNFVYCYDQDAQPPRISACDGYSSVHVDRLTGRRVASIGISVQALRAGEDFAGLILLHELAHVLIDDTAAHDHDEAFHALLDQLIERFNQKTGKAIVNDYQGLEKLKDEHY